MNEGQNPKFVKTPDKVNKGGRPTKKQATAKKISLAMTKLNAGMIKKLEDACSIDASIDEMCLHADISPQTYYNWMKKKPKLLERLNRLRHKPNLRLRQIAVHKAGDSYATAMDYLSRKLKNEFGQSGHITAVQVNIDVKKDKAELFKILEENRNDN